jgi:hypothetical protein
VKLNKMQCVGLYFERSFVTCLKIQCSIVTITGRMMLNGPRFFFICSYQGTRLIPKNWLKSCRSWLSIGYLNFFAIGYTSIGYLFYLQSGNLLLSDIFFIDVFNIPIDNIIIIQVNVDFHV